GSLADRERIRPPRASAAPSRPRADPGYAAQCRLGIRLLRDHADGGRAGASTQAEDPVAERCHRVGQIARLQAERTGLAAMPIRWKVTLSALLAVTLGLAVAGWLALRSIERHELARLQ